MKTTVNINGTDIPVEVQINEDQVIKDYVRNLVKRAVDYLHEENHFDIGPLTQEELRNIQDTIMELDYGTLIAMGKFFHEISKLYDRVIEERAKYYTFKIPYSGEIEVVVKAHSEDEAKDYIHSMSHYDLCDYVNIGDIDFAEYEADVDSISMTVAIGVDVEDATDE